MLVHVDASRHRWSGPGRPYTSLVGAIDDATGEVPLAVYSDRHSVFWRSSAERESLAEERAACVSRPSSAAPSASVGSRRSAPTRRRPTAGSSGSGARSTSQDRLVAELRLAGISTVDGAHAFGPSDVARHNARFAIAPADPVAAWRSLPPGMSAERVCWFKYSRIVSADTTVRLDGALLQLPRRGTHWSWAGERLEIRQSLDGSWRAHAPGGAELARSAVPATAPTVRARDYTRAPIPGVAPLRRGATSPWRKGFTDWHPVDAARTVRTARGRSA